MAECDWAILCDNGFQDINRKACLIGIFERLNAVSVPVALPHATLAVKVLGSPGEGFSLRIQAVHESGATTFSVESTATIPDSGSFDLLLNMVGIVFNEFGSYSLNVFIGDYLSRATTFIVAQAPTPPPTP